MQEGSSRRSRELVRLLNIHSIDQRLELSVSLKQRPALRIKTKGFQSYSEQSLFDSSSGCIACC